MRPIRSLLYVPANKESWVVEAPDRYQADGYIFDLEDSVPLTEKEAARTILRDAYSHFTETDSLITARVNPPSSDEFAADLDTIVSERLDAIVIPKLPSVEAIARADHLLTFLEQRRGIDRRTEIIALPETASGFYHTYDLCRESDRVAAVAGGTTRGADVERALGFEWTEKGTEKQHFLSKLLLDGRAAGVDQFLAGAWADVDNIEGLRSEATMVRRLGYTGYQAIHPSHIEPINELFTPDPERVAYYKRLLETLDVAAVEERRASVRFEGEMIDIAHIKRAKQGLARAKAFGVLD